MPKIKVKYNKKNHSFSKWMTNDILQSRLYKSLMQTYTDNTDLLNSRKDEYKQYLRKQIREANGKYCEHILYRTRCTRGVRVVIPEQKPDPVTVLV